MWMTKMLMSWIGVTIVIAAMLSTSEAVVLPGMETRVTQRGLDFLRYVAVEKMETMVIGQTIPEQSGESTFYDYEVYNMQVTDLEVPKSHIYVKDVTSTGVGLQIYASISASVAGDFDIKIMGVYHASGPFEATISSASATVLVSLSATYSQYSRKGVPFIQYEDCSFDAGSVDVHLSGHSHWSKKASTMLAKELNEKACGQISSVIYGRLQPKLEELSMEMLFYDGRFELDYSLVSQPGSYYGSIDLNHKGAVYAVRYPYAPPLPVPRMRRDTEVSRMFYVWITDFLVNSAGYAFHNTGMLRYIITQKDVPPMISMNTSGFPIKTIFPQVAKLYPGRLMQLVVLSTAPPEVNTTEDKVTAYAYGNIEAYVTQRNNTLPYLFTLSSNLSLSFQLGMKGRNLTWISKMESVDLNLVNSTISDLKIDMLKAMLRPAIDKFVIPKLNKLGATGYRVPGVKGFYPMNTSVTQGNGFLKVATDLACEQDYTLGSFY